MRAADTDRHVDFHHAPGQGVDKSVAQTTIPFSNSGGAKNEADTQSVAQTTIPLSNSGGVKNEADNRAAK